jgi:hypothetical protein
MSNKVMCEVIGMVRWGGGVGRGGAFTFSFISLFLLTFAFQIFQPAPPDPLTLDPHVGVEGVMDNCFSLLQLFASS